MSDIQEEQKRLYKRAEENDLKATMKSLFPDDVEMVCILKDDYDRLYGDLSYENIELKDKYNKQKEVLDKIKEIIDNMKPLSLVETSIKEELKSAYNPKESSIKGTDEYFDTVCHLEDFEVQIWNIKELLEEIE